MLYQLSYWPITVASRQSSVVSLNEKVTSPMTETDDSRLVTPDYFVSLCPVCFLQYRQYLLSSRRSDDFFRFFVVL